MLNIRFLMIIMSLLFIAVSKTQSVLLPTVKPTAKPTVIPTAFPTVNPTTKPSAKPTAIPTTLPTVKPTVQPTRPTALPTAFPTVNPTTKPSAKPTAIPTTLPTVKPTVQPTRPTAQPSVAPTPKPTLTPTAVPSRPTAMPTAMPTRPTAQPTPAPSPLPTISHRPTVNPTPVPTGPTESPTAQPTIINYHNELHRSVDLSTFITYSNLWAAQHATWIGIVDNDVNCPNSVYFPVCVNGIMLGTDKHAACATYVCQTPSVCDPFMPPDTLDVLPPQANTTLDEPTICTPPESPPFLTLPYLGLDQGIPPYFTPMAVIPLKVFGTVSAVSGEKCILISNAVVEAWQVDVSKLPLHTAEPLISPVNLKNVSCRGSIETGPSGTFEFSTTLPAVYGPPRHINFVVTADGYETLTTRLYFADDWRLQQTASLDEATTEFRRIQWENTRIPGTLRGLPTDDDSSQEPGSEIWEHWNKTNLNHIHRNIPLPGILAEDPRVIKLNFVQTGKSITMDYVLGHFVANFSIVMKPLRPVEQAFNGAPFSNQTQPPVGLSGLWSTRDGDLVQIEESGRNFIAIEYPHVRSWGTVSGVLDGDTILGVNFRSSSEILDDSIPTMDSPPWTVVQSSSIDYEVNKTGGLMPGSFSAIYSDNVWSSSISSGAIIVSDEFVTDTNEAKIVWTGGGYNTEWSRYVIKQGYRYLKLLVTRETGGYKGGKMVINEITFYEGILGQREVPSKFMKMESPRFPLYQMVTCSSFESQITHCYRAFDGDSSSDSAWMTQPVGSKDRILASPQWVLIDLGPGRGVFPSSMKIVCDNEHASSPMGCPMTFMLSGSYDNIRFTELFRQDYYDYMNEYANGGIVSDFFWESPVGRLNGHRCGTCNQGPRFTCNIDGYDSTCASRYCDIDGRCAPQRLCKAGQYLDVTFASTGRGVTSGTPATSCKDCPAGRYGASAGLRSPGCSGECSEGYYCTGGSTTPTQFQCGDVNSFCPVGSSSPSRATAGRKTISLDDKLINYKYSSAALGANLSAQYNSQSTETAPVRVADTLCDPGHYCVGGQQIPCRVGVYGNATGLATAECSEPCVAGQYCPLASVVPLICDKGYYCPDGMGKIPCPAGTFGATRGLKDKSCSGLCKPGFYCPSGSTNATSVYCPAGKYGSEYGLRESNCSGDCSAGFYCPGPPIASNGQPTGRLSSYTPNTQFRMIECGSPQYFCPRGSQTPTTVSVGYYSVGGNETQRSAQAICETGFYCVGGIKYSCPAGSYGISQGLSFPYGPDDAIYFCSGLCEPGYYCPPNSTSSKQVACPPGTYGEISGLPNSLCSATCPLGHYCEAASVLPRKCPAGRFGNNTGLTTSSCSKICETMDGSCDDTISLCREGFYCPEGSVSSDQYECGGPSVYCPRGSGVPIPVSNGYYTIGPLTPGSNPAELLVDVSIDFSDYDSPPNVLLSAPLVSAKFRRTDQNKCEIGHFCVQGVKSPCPLGTFGATMGLDSVLCSALCPTGHYCPLRTAIPIPCPAGRYGSTVGLSTSSCSGPCSAGYVCPSGSNSSTQVQCGSASGLLLHLYYKNAAFGGSNLDDLSLANELTNIVRDMDNILPELTSVSSSAILSSVGSRGYDANLLLLGNSVFCPTGSSAPLLALPGFYTINGNSTIRSSQLSCPMGSYCISGVIRDCPAGRYGRAERLLDASCSGPCQRGFYCPPGSISATQKSCPIGRYGATNGLGNPGCTGACLHPLDCPEGSIFDGYLPTNMQPSIW